MDCTAVELPRTRQAHSPAEAWRNSVFVFFSSAYFDASSNGQTSGGSFVVAGWLATGEQWDTFGVAWQKVLDKYGVPYMHMKEFAHSVGAFADGWKGDESKRRSFIQDLNSVIAFHRTASFVCAVNRPEFESLNDEFRLREYFGNEYAFCGMTCVQQVYKWLTERGLPASAECVFEDGDERGRLTELMKSRGYPEPVFRPKRDRITPVGIIPGRVPLQAADMLAYELHLNYDRYGEDAPEVLRKSFLKLAESTDHRGFWAKLTADKLRENARDLDLER
jgi:hypothetical protein